MLGKTNTQKRSRDRNVSVVLCSKVVGAGPGVEVVPVGPPRGAEFLQNIAEEKKTRRQERRLQRPPFACSRCCLAVCPTLVRASRALAEDASLP